MLLAVAVVMALVAVSIVLPQRAAAATPVVYTLRPDADVSNCGNSPPACIELSKRGCTENWQCVAEVTSDGDSSYVYSKTFGLWDWYSMQDLPFSGTVNSVTTVVVARVSSGGCTANCLIMGVHDTNTAIWWNQNNPSFSSGYTTISFVWSTNPTKGIPWTIQDVNDLQLVIQQYSGGSMVRVTQAYLDINITPAAGVVTLRPNAAGDVTAWSTSKGCSVNWQCVADITPDGDSTYVYSKTFGAWDWYNLQDLPFSGTITSVTVYAVARISSGTCATLCLILGVHDPNSAVWWNQNSLAFNSSYSTVSVTWPSNPTNGGVAWTVSDVNALQVVIQQYSGGSTVRVTQVYIGVNITPS